MTPRRLDPEVVDARMRSLEPLLERLAQLRDVSGEALEEDLDLRLVVERILTLLVDTAVSVNSHVVTASGRPSPAGLRNLLSHRYGQDDHRRVVAAVPRAVDDYTDYVAQVSRWLLTAGS